MFLRKKPFIVPEYLETNRNGRLHEKQRRGFLIDVLLLVLAVVLLLGSCLAMYFTGRLNFFTLIMLGGAALVVSYSGLVQPFPNVSVRKGG